MTVQLIDTKPVDTFISTSAANDGEIALWLGAILKKSLLARPESARPLNNLPADAPAWLVRKWRPGHGLYHVFRPDDALRQKTRRITEWLVRARKDDDPFLRRRDAQGCPLALRHLTLDTALEKAEDYFSGLKKVFAAAARKLPAEQRVMTFDDGSYIAQPRTKAELE